MALILPNNLEVIIILNNKKQAFFFILLGGEYIYANSLKYSAFIRKCQDKKRQIITQTLFNIITDFFYSTTLSNIFLPMNISGNRK